MSTSPESPSNPEDLTNDKVRLDPAFRVRLESLSALMGDGTTVESLVNSAVEEFIGGMDDVLNDDNIELKDL